MVRNVGYRRDVRRDDDTGIGPKARIWRTLELAIIDVQRDATQFPFSQSLQKRRFIYNFAARDVHQDGSRLHRGESVGIDKMMSLLRPWAAHGDERAFAQQIIQTIRGLYPREAARSQRIGRNMTTRAEHPHARRRTELGHLVANTAGADDADCLIPNYHSIVRFMIEMRRCFSP